MLSVQHVQQWVRGIRRKRRLILHPTRCALLPVTTPVIVGQIFHLQIFIVNRTKHTPRFMVVVPNRKRVSPDTMGAGIMKNTLPPLPLTGEPELFMEETGKLSVLFIY